MRVLIQGPGAIGRFLAARFALALLICRELARDVDIDIPVVEAAIRDYTELVELGDSDNDISGLIRLRRRQG